MQRYLIYLTLAFAAAIAFATLASVSIPYAIYYKSAPWLGNPDMHNFATIEHLLVFAVLGALLDFAFPKRIIIVLSTVFLGVTLLESLQTLTADRHGTVLDACQKVTGGFMGALMVHVITWWRRIPGSENNNI
jgi:hypothetical protein